MGWGYRISFALLLFSGHMAFAQGWNYEYAYRCLKALASDIHPPGTPVIFNRTGTGVFSGPHSGLSGFFVVTPKVAYFFSQDEMTRSGDASSTQMKVTVNAPAAVPPHVKVYYNPAAVAPQESITIGVANEFDRIIDATPATEDSSRPAMITAMGGALRQARALVTTNKLGLKPVVELCTKTRLDFPMDMGNGTESRFAIELRHLHDKMKPGFFSMEYWFPEKSTN